MDIGHLQSELESVLPGVVTEIAKVTEGSVIVDLTLYMENENVATGIYEELVALYESSEFSLLNSSTLFTKLAPVIALQLDGAFDLLPTVQLLSMVLVVHLL
jgi:hypothetical protein